MPGGAMRGLDGGRGLVDQACLLLTAPSPGNLQNSAGLLEAAIGQLRSAVVSTGDDKIRAELGRLQASIRRAATLLQNAAAYHNGWHGWFGQRVGGYQADGGPAGVARQVVVNVKG
jgi:hypothetical protein